MEYSISLSEILVAVLTITAAGLGFIIREQKEKISTIQNQLSDKKYKLYHDIYSVFFNILKGQKGFEKTEEDKLAIFIMDIKKDILIYAPDEVVKKYFEWNRFVSNNGSDIQHAKIFLELFILIRKDMGHRDTSVTESEILGLIMSTDDELNKMKKLLNIQ